ncbi:MAG: DUF5666 domain-containing protein [Parcubacteria group bacterium]|jgi:hypothetical protein
MDIKEAAKSKNFRVAAIAVGIILIIFVSFAGGVMVGLKKARFSYKFGENYERNFVGSHMDMMGRPGPGGLDFPPGGPLSHDFRNAHGLAGTIISIADNNIVVKDRDGKENTINVTEKTVIKRQRDDIKIEDLKQGDQIVVMGNPGDNGALNADLIRVFSSNGNN